MTFDSKCPKCGTGELEWTKTKSGKNWLKDQNGNWHTCTSQEKPSEISASTPARENTQSNSEDKLSYNDPSRCAFRGSKREKACFRKADPKDSWGYCPIHGQTERAHSGAMRMEYKKKSEAIQENEELDSE